MAVDPLESAWKKYNWASNHMKAVDAATSRSLDPNLHAITLNAQVEQDGTKLVAVIRIATLPPLRADLGLAVGDVIHNLRSALDHVAWALVQEVGRGKRLTDWQKRKVQFPMISKASDWSKVDKWLPGVPDDYRRIIRRYQPYRRGDHPKAIRWLNKLSNMDKHRVLIPAVVNHSRFECSVSSDAQITNWEWLVTRPRALNVGTPVLKLGLAPSATADCKVEAEAEVAVHPSLGYGRAVFPSLGLISETVYRVLAEIEEVL